MPLTSPRVSAELFMIPIDGHYLIYAPLRQAAFLANQAVVNLLVDLQEGEWDVLHSESAEFLEFLKRLEIVDADDEIPPITKFSGDPQPTTVSLFLTTACNLRCTYCYASAGDTPNRVMPLKVAQRGIDFVIANALALGRPGIEIAYHGGGEPTVNWKTLTESYEYARNQVNETGLDVRAGLATNGVISEEKIDWIVSHLDSVSLSFDGLPKVHDANRLTINGQGSSSKVIETIRRFDQVDFAYGLRLTVTREHIPSMEASVRFICENFRPRRIQVEPAYQLGRWSEAPSAETADFIAGFRAAQAAAETWGRRIEFSGARIGTLTNHFCGITQDSFCLTADGNVSACYETFFEENVWAKTFFYGEYSSEEERFQFNLPVLNNLRSQTVDQRDFCQGCFAKWSCGGDCHHKALAVSGGGEFTGTDRCHVIRELTKDQILDRIRNSGGLFWHEETVESASRPTGVGP